MIFGEPPTDFLLDERGSIELDTRRSEKGSTRLSVGNPACDDYACVNDDARHFVRLDAARRTSRPS
jgi:hypothetical protein